MNEKSMNVKELAEYFGKSTISIYRYLKHLSFVIENGKEFKANKYVVETLAKYIYPKMPLSIKESINYTFSNVNTQPYKNEKVDTVLTIKDIPIIVAETVKHLLPLIQNQSQKQVEYKQDYFTLKAWHLRNGLQMPPMTELRQLGKEAVRVSQQMNHEVKKADDEIYGFVNSYHIEVLKKVFEI